MYFWVPQSGSMGVGVSILSYAGKVYFGMISDRQLIAAPQSVEDRFGPEFERLLLAVTQTVQGLKLNKWVAVFGDETNSVMITASIPSEHSKRLSPILRDCVLHAEYGAQD